jgi:hypothetical protein
MRGDWYKWKLSKYSQQGKKSLLGFFCIKSKIL